MKINAATTLLEIEIALRERNARAVMSLEAGRPSGERFDVKILDAQEGFGAGQGAYLHEAFEMAITSYDARLRKANQKAETLRSLFNFSTKKKGP